MHERAVEHGKFEIELLDLAKFHLPLYDEPKHPSLQQYEHDHTKRWSASVAAADAFVIVTPEYNYGPPPSLINAFDYVYGNGTINQPVSSATAGSPAAFAPCRWRSRPSRR